MKRILVTGNNGLLGQVVTKVLSDSNKYFPVFFKTENLKRNIINVAHCQEALEGVDGVIHLASCQAYKNATDAGITGPIKIDNFAFNNGLGISKQCQCCIIG